MFDHFCFFKSNQIDALLYFPFYPPNRCITLFSILSIKKMHYFIFHSIHQKDALLYLTIFLCRLDMHQRMVLCSSSPPCYNYYQTNQASRWPGSHGNQLDDKYDDMNSWLESVLENNLNALAACSENTNTVESDDGDGVLLGEDYTWFYRPNQRCTSIMPCAEHETPIWVKKKLQKMTTIDWSAITWNQWKALAMVLKSRVF